MARLFVCGDIMNMSGNTEFIGQDIGKVINEADYAIANLEGPELFEGQICSSPHQNKGTVKYLKDIGFDLMLLANNHIAELGESGINNTISQINQYNLDYIGVGFSLDEVYKPIIKDIEGIRFAMLNVCEAQKGYFWSTKQKYGYAWIGYDNLLPVIHNASQIADYVLVFVHAGLEHQCIPLPEFRSLYKKMCDAGASAVIGAHPHTPQGYEYYGEKLIAYSLGNFYLPRSNNDWAEENKSYSLLVDFRIGHRISIEPIFHHLDGGVVNLVKDSVQCIDLEMLCNILGGGYDLLADEMCNTVYKELCGRLISYATLGEYEGINLLGIIKNILRITLFRRRYVTSSTEQRDKLLLRLFENESYRYTIIRSLKNKYNE